MYGVEVVSGGALSIDKLVEERAPLMLKTHHSCLRSFEKFGEEKGCKLGSSTLDYKFLINGQTLMSYIQ